MPLLRKLGSRNRNIGDMKFYSRNEKINIWKGNDIEHIRASNRMCAEILKNIVSQVEPGITTGELDRIAEQMILERGARPAFKGYQGYPATLCISINDQVVHGIPGERRIHKSDIVSIDIGVQLNDFYGDCATTVPAGEVEEPLQHLLSAAEASLYAGIDQAVPGNRLTDISHAIQKAVEEAGFSVVQDFVGHGIGRSLHEPPQIPNFGPAGTGPLLRAGMVLAIEPMVNEGDYRVRIGRDGWTATTLDGSFSAHFEHAVLIRERGPEILTRV